MTKQILFLFLFFLLAPSHCLPLSTTPDSLPHRNSIQLEMGGPGLIYSINYERFLFYRSQFKTAIRIGTGWYPPTTGTIGLWVPCIVNEMISFGSHHAEIGIGIVYTNDLYTDKKSLPGITELYNFLTFHIGYRYQVPGDRFIFRIGFTPLIEYSTFINDKPVNGKRVYSHLGPFHPSACITFGYRF